MNKKSNYVKYKRITDIVLASVGIVLAAPLMAGISIAIRLDSKGPILFRQKRVGIHKKHFDIYKFRTMYEDTPKNMPTHLLQNPDAMVTKTGRFLRKYSLDELPQLFNILKGDMGIVGPRPALWNQFDLIAERDKYGANDVLPGLTGWAQINGRDELEIPVKAKLDGDYVARFGLWMDLRCILGTVKAVLRHDGVVEGGTGELARQNEKQKDDGSCSGVPVEDVRHMAEALPCVGGSDEEAAQKGSLEKNKKRVLVTGADSYIGMSVEKWLMKQPNRYQVDTLDMRDASWRKKDFSGYDVVYHVAGIAHADVGHVSKEQKKLYYDVNCKLAVETAKKARKEGVRQFILMSSMIIYGESAPLGKQKRITPQTKPHPSNFYGDSKWQADRRVRALETPDFKVCVLRPPMIYGKGSKGNYPKLAKLAKITPIFPQAWNERSMLYIENLCAFVQLMIDHEETGVFFPQNREYSCTSKMVEMIAKAHGKKLRLVKMFAPQIWLASFMPGKPQGLVNKVFGNFCYEKNMSRYPKGEYQLYSLKESIYRMERL